MSTPNNMAQTMAQAANGDSSLLNQMANTMQIENPNFNPDAVSWTNVQGIAQITQGTWNQWNPGVPYSTDPQAQFNTMARMLTTYNADYGGDFTLMYTAYNAGPAVANQAQSLMQAGTSESDAISQALGGAYSGTALIQKLQAIQKASTLAGSNPVSNAVQTTAINLGVDDSDPATAVPIAGMTISQGQLTAVMAAIDPPLTINSGLDSGTDPQTPWFRTANLVLPNRPTSSIPDPVTFQIYFDRAGSPLPVVLSLLASVRTHQKSLRHVPTRQRTQTGLLVNLWGMAPDQISGQASTGLMVNALGVTDFLSLSTIPSDVQQMISQSLGVGKALAQLGSSSGTLTTTTNPTQSQAQSLSPVQAQQNYEWAQSHLYAAQTADAAVNQPDAMRVAAKDAFIEFLSMFKNNGNVWFRNQNYTGYTTGQEQVSADAWSQLTGSTSFQNVSRRNDVMTRGQVVMYFRNAAYYGYFKNLAWVMDAKSPFRWNFNFVFQVESTIFNVSLPT